MPELVSLQSLLVPASQKRAPRTPPRRCSLKLERTMIRASALVALGMLILACGIDPAVSREHPVHGKQQQNSVTQFVPRVCMTYGGRHRIGV